MTSTISIPRAPAVFPASEWTDRNEVTDLTELVRGHEKELLAWLAPVVRRHSVTLDLSRVLRIDAAGVSALLTLYSSAQQSGHHFSVANLTPRVAEVLKLVGLERILRSRGAGRKSDSSSRLECTAA